VEIVRRLIAAVNERDVGAYLACCTEDIRLCTPWAPVEGAYEGAGAIRRFFADLEDTLPDFRLSIERAEPIGAERVLAFVRAFVSGRASGIPATAMSGGVPDPAAPGYIPTANVYDFVGGKIASIRVFLERAEALEAVGLRE
jgi:SnoaL-like domain